MLFCFLWNYWGVFRYHFCEVEKLGILHDTCSFVFFLFSTALPVCCVLVSYSLMYLGCWESCNPAQRNFISSNWILLSSIKLLLKFPWHPLPKLKLMRWTLSFQYANGINFLAPLMMCDFAAIVSIGMSVLQCSFELPKERTAKSCYQSYLFKWFEVFCMVTGLSPLWTEDMLNVCSINTLLI